MMPLERVMLAKAMEYPKETLAGALVMACGGDAELLGLQVMVAELHRQRRMLADTRRMYVGLPIEAVTGRRAAYLRRRMAIINGRIKQLEDSFDAWAASTKGAETG